MDKIKIVYYCDTKSKRKGIGGAEIYLYTLLKNLNRNKFKPFLICPNDKNHKKWRQSIRKIKVGVFPIFKHNKSLFANSKKIKKILKKINPQIMHLQFWTAYSCGAGLIASKLAKIPIVFSTEHSFLPLDKESKSIPLKAAFHLLKKRLINYPTTVSYASKTMMQKKQLFFNKKIYVIHNGIDLNKNISLNNNISSLKPINKNKIHLVDVGSLEKGKGQKYLIKAISKLAKKIKKKINLHLIGDGEDKKSLQRLTNKLKLKNAVIFWGTRNDVVLLLPKFDLFVFPTLMENFPLVILESMNAGLPIISSNVGGINEALKNKKGGFLIPAGNPQALAEKICYLIKKPKLRAKMGEYNRKLVKMKFSDKIMTENTEKLYKKAIINLKISSHQKLFTKNSPNHKSRLTTTKIFKSN